jgi:NAD(P)-dependent dehydrogenase (short-subunit alcohol dehydrogenase family)
MALVTGAGRRLGREIAQGLAHQGYAIGLHYHRSEAQALETARLIEAAGAPVLPLPADLTQPEQVMHLFSRIEQSGYPLKVLVNSAGIMVRGDLRNLSVESWDETFNLNLRAPWLCARQAAQLMDAEGGVIININDAGYEKVWTGYPAYILSKSALETLTRLLARSLAPGIRVNGVAPGLILPSDDLDPEEWDRLINRLPLKRMGDPQDVFQAVLYLIKNDYVTGQTLVVDGGYQLV